MLHTLWPRSADRTDVVCEWFFEPATIAAEGFDPSDAIEFWDQVNREDWHVCELTAEGRAHPRLRGRPLLGRGGRRARLRLDGRRALHGGAARGSREGPGEGRGARPVNEIAAKLGEVGLPEPVAELAKRDWDADRRRRRPQRADGGRLPGAGRAHRCWCWSGASGSGGACTLERPFSDERYVVSPCAYVVGLLDDLVIRELELERRGLRYWMADPNLWVPFDDGTAFGQWLDDSNAPRRTSRSSASRRATSRATGPTRSCSTRFAASCARATRDTWVGDAPTPGRDRGAPRRGPDDDRPGLRGLDRRRARRSPLRRAPEDGPVRAGDHRHLGRAQGPGHRLDQADALPGRHGRPGAALGIRRGRHGDGQLRDRRRGARGGRGARLRRSRVRDRPRRGRHARGRHFAPGGRP